MSLLKYLIIILLIYLIFRYIKRRLLDGIAQHLKDGKPNEGSKVLQDKIVPCPTCGTYNPTKTAYIVGEDLFCNQDCFEKRLK